MRRKKKLSLEDENNTVIVSPPLTKEIVEKYKKPVSEKFYGEIVTDALIETPEIEVKQTSKPKKRRL